MSMLIGNARPRLRALAITTLTLGAIGAVLASAAALAAEPHEVSQAVLDKFNPASEAIKKRDFGGGLKLAKECLSVAKAGYEKYVCTNLIYGAASYSGSFREAVEAGESLLSMSDVPSASKLQIQKSLASIYPRLNEIPKAIAMTKEYMKTTGGSPADWAILANLYGAQRNCGEAMPALDKALAGSKQPDESQLKTESFCYDKGKQYDKLVAVDEELLKRYPKRDWFRQLLNLYEGDKKVEDMALLHLLRFGFDRDYLDDEGDYVRLANLCLDVGAAAESQRVLERGIQKKLIKQTGAAEKNGRLLEQAKTTAASDKKSLEQADAEARAGKNGESDIRVGVRYFATQQYEKAAEAIQRGLQPDRAARVKRPDDANMVLGMAYLKLKKNAEASKAFAAAKADPRMTAVARIWANAS